jgi:hypothetical protein
MQETLIYARLLRVGLDVRFGSNGGVAAFPGHVCFPPKRHSRAFMSTQLGSSSPSGFLNHS